MIELPKPKNNESPVEHKMRMILTILFINLGLLANAWSACLEDLNRAIQERLAYELRLEMTPQLLRPSQKVYFNRINFRKEEQELILETIDEVNILASQIKGLKVPDNFSLSCGIEVRTGCLHFHHLYFDSDLLSFSGQLTRNEKKAIIAHEYGHMLFNRSMYEDLPELVEFSRYGNDHLFYMKKAKKASSDQDILKYSQMGNDARLKQLELQESMPYIRVYDALGELFADSMAVAIAKDSNIVSDSVGKTYLLKLKKYKSIDQFPIGIKKKLDYRRFGVKDQILDVEVSSDIHQTFFLARQAMGGEFNVDQLFLSFRKAFLEMKDMHPGLVKSFSDLINQLDKETSLELNQKISFENAVKKLNQILIDQLVLKNRS